MAGPTYLPQGRILPVPPALQGYRSDPSGVQVPAPPGFMYYRGQLIPISRAVTPDEQAWRNAGGPPDLSPQAANPDAYTTGAPGQPNVGAPMLKPVDIPPAPYNPSTETRLPRSGGPRLTGPALSLSPNSLDRGTTVTGLTPRLKNFSEMAGDAMDWLHGAFDKVKAGVNQGNQILGGTGYDLPQGGPAPAAASGAPPVPTAPQPNGGRLMMNAMFGNNPRQLPPQDFPVPQPAPPMAAVAPGAQPPPINPDVMSAPPGPASAFANAAGGGAAATDQPWQPSGMTELGLRLMAASEAQPGSVRGPSLFGSVAGAGLSQIESQRARQAAQAQMGLEQYKIQADAASRALLADVDSQFKLVSAQVAQQGVQINKATLRASIEDKRNTAIDKARSDPLLMTDATQLQQTIAGINQRADAQLRDLGASGTNNNNNSSDQYDEVRTTADGSKYGIRGGKAYGPL